MTERWKYSFSSQILSRGEDYYYSGLVHDLEKDGNTYTATVSGTDDYEVTIEMDEDNDVSYMECTCPYAEEHDTCKHMAAVLYEITEGKSAVSVEEGNRESMDDIIANMTEENLREELKYCINENRNLYEYIYNKYRTEKAGTSDIRKFVSSLNSLAYECGDRYGFIGWSEGGDYVSEFETCLDHYLEPMLERKEYMVAFEALKEAFHIVETVDMDGSGGEHGTLGDDIGEYWKRIIQMASAEDKQILHDWFFNMNKKSGGMINGDEITEILENEFQEKKYTLPLLDQVRSDLNDPEKSYLIDTNLKKYRAFLERCDMPLKEYEDWLSKHEDLEVVMNIRLSEAKEAGDTESVITILKNLCEKETVSWRKRERMDDLLKIYEENGLKKEEKEILLKLLLEEGSTSHVHIQKLRNLCEKDEWNRIRDFYLCSHKTMRLEIYWEEKMYDEVLDVLKDSPLETVDEYEYEMKEKYPEAILSIYLNGLQRMENDHPCAKLYERMRKYLLQTAGFAGGKEPVLDLISQWTMKYPKRTAMLGMLRDVKQQI